MTPRVTERLAKLDQIRAATGEADTPGLPREAVEPFLAADPDLGRAVDQAHDEVVGSDGGLRELRSLDEAELCRRLRERYLNFYPSDGLSGYVPAASRGPWIVTAHGAVVYDAGGYGMLGFGHAPDAVLERLGRPWSMANVMTPSVSQERFADRLEAEIGHRRGGCPYHRFMCMNSGSEAVALTARIADLHARAETDPGGRHAGREYKLLALTHGFHGRTALPAHLSHSTRAAYAEHLASFRDEDGVRFVPVEDEAALERAFADAERDGEFYAAMYLEPVLGEGAPGHAVSRGYYDAARRLTREHGALLVVDSIQAALRAHGCLSVVDYPGFEDCDPPDMETYSKALNAGQFPLSVVALSRSAAERYVPGVYGNTMTTNPRALEVGCAVLDLVDDGLRANIRARGEELRAGLEALARRRPDAVLGVEGTGLLACAELEPDSYPVTGAGGVEQYLRTHGLHVIHGGANGVRLTPSFTVTPDEIELMVAILDQALAELGPDRLANA